MKEKLKQIISYVPRRGGTFEFIKNNLMFISIVIGVIALYSLYTNSSYRIRNFNILGYKSNLNQQIDVFCDSLAESIIDIVKIYGDIIYLLI